MLVVSMQICVLLFLLVATAWGGELRCLRPGAPVISRYRENRYFPGRVDGLGDSIDVTFENGQQQSYGSFTNEVIVDDVPDINELAGGARVLARRPRSTSFEPGFVNGSIEGLPMNDTFLVNFDSGDSIARNIQDIRIADKPRSCMNEKGIYIGCFENVINNFLTNYYPVNPTDIATCNWACFTRGFRFAGLQNGTWCFCGNHVNDTLKVDDNDCNIACRDSREDVCGGYQRMTVYWTGADYDDNSTRDFGEFADAKGQEASDQDLLKLESSTKRACVDVYNSEQCNTWADQAKCIENPDWMIANCKKSCYACDYDEHNSDDKPDSSLEKYTPVTSSSPQSQPNMYQSPAGYQTSSDYAQNSYSTSKKSDHSVLDSTGNTPGYLGCFRDSPTSHDLEYLADIRPLSIRGCITKCKSMRFPYSGVQSSSSCYCGLHYGKYGQLEHEDCNTPCEADASEMCGGISKNSLYHTGFPVKFKSAESGLTRKNLPSLAVNTADSSRPYPSNPSYNYPSQYPQPPYYPQQNRGYASPVYPPPSPYTQASSYPQTSNARTNEYQSAYNYNNQPSSSVQSGTTNSARRDFSPADSSSYRWRETYVKLRQQEQDRYSKPSPRNLKRISKLPQNPWPKIRGNSAKSLYPRKDKTKDSSKLQNLGNDAKIVKDTSTKSSSRSNSFSQSLYNQLMSQMYTNSQGRNSDGNKKIHRRKSTKRRRKHLQGKPGVFLRKKASKESSFLAFLPHEVTKNESLLQNVYNMLSVMLKNLRKHKKSSMKNLKKYLKFSESDEENSKFARKMSSHVSGHKKRTHHSKKRAERKWKGAKTHKSAKVDSKRVEPAPLQHQKMAKNHSSLGQKQLSKPEEISNPGMQPMTYTPRDDQTITNGSLAAKHVMSSRGKSAVNLNKTAQSFRDVVKTHHNIVTGLNQTQMTKSVFSSTFQKQIKKVSDVHRNLSEFVPKVRKAGKLLDHHENGTRIQETTRSYNSQLPNNNLEKFIDTFKHSTKPAERSFQTQSRKNASLDENIRKAVSPKTKPTKGILKKLNNKKLNKKKLNKKKLPRLKTKGKARVKLDQQEAESQANEDDTMEESDDDTMEKSNDEMISSIVDLLEKEKKVRMKNNSDNQSTQDGGERKQPEKEEKRKKRNNKKGKHERKHRTGKNDEEKTTKRIYKKDHLGRAGGDGETRDDHDYNLMQEDEDFREINGNNIE